MKEEFIGYYNPTDTEINQAWDKGVFSFDANTILNLYRYSDETRNDFIGVLEQIQDRIWMTYQATYEFHTNRLVVIDSIKKSYQLISQKLDDTIQAIEKELNSFKRHPIIKIDDIKQKIKTHFESLKSDLTELLANHPDYSSEDQILDKLTTLLKKIGQEPSDSELNDIYELGRVRYEKKIPPGYADIVTKKNKGDRHLYGDLIIWKELIKETKRTKNEIIFVTDDRKDDWWSKFNGETIRPREELIKEFFKETGIRILIYQADKFLEYSKLRLNQHIDEKSINEVREIRKLEETKKKNTERLKQTKYRQLLESLNKIDLSNQNFVTFEEDINTLKRINQLNETFNRIKELTNKDYSNFTNTSSPNSEDLPLLTNISSINSNRLSNDKSTNQENSSST